MFTAIVLIDADVARIPEVAAEVAGLAGVEEVFSVTGDIDIIAMVRVKEHEDLAKVISDQIGKVPGVLGMTTYLAFQTFSEADLDEAFHIGLD